jgi:hypothetical protein
VNAFSNEKHSARAPIIKRTKNRSPEGRRQFAGSTDSHVQGQNVDQSQKSVTDLIATIEPYTKALMNTIKSFKEERERERETIAFMEKNGEDGLL